MMFGLILLKLHNPSGSPLSPVSFNSPLGQLESTDNNGHLLLKVGAQCVQNLSFPTARLQAGPADLSVTTACPYLS